MKFKECNARQKKAWKNIKYAAADYIFGLENGCHDYPEDSKEYHDYLTTLCDFDALKDVVYQQSITCVYDEGYVGFGAGAESYLKDIRFCGKDFLMRLVTKYCSQFQAEALSNLGLSMAREISCMYCGTKAMGGFICPECGRTAEESTSDVSKREEVMKSMSSTDLYMTRMNY